RTTPDTPASAAASSPLSSTRLASRTTRPTPRPRSDRICVLTASSMSSATTSATVSGPAAESSADTLNPWLARSWLTMPARESGSAAETTTTIVSWSRSRSAIITNAPLHPRSARRRADPSRPPFPSAQRGLNGHPGPAIGLPGRPVRPAPRPVRALTARVHSARGSHRHPRRHRRPGRARRRGGARGPSPQHRDRRRRIHDRRPRRCRRMGGRRTPDDLAVSGCGRHRPDCVPAAAQRVDRCGAAPVRDPDPVARGPRGLDRRGGRRRDPRLLRAVRRARPANVARLPRRRPRRRDRQSRQHPPERRARGGRRGPSPALRRRPAGDRRRPRDGRLRPAEGQADETVLAGRAEDPTVPAPRPARGHDADHPRRRDAPGAGPAAVVRPGADRPRAAPRRLHPALAPRPQADDPERRLGGRRQADRRAEERRQRRPLERGPADDRARRRGRQPERGARAVLASPVDGRLSAATTTKKVTGTLFVTDVVFSNPNGREGALVLLRDADHLFDIRLENIRDLDYHFVTPIVLTDGQSLNLSLACTGANASPCDPTVFYSGYTRP